MCNFCIIIILFRKPLMYVFEDSSLSISSSKFCILSKLETLSLFKFLFSSCNFSFNEYIIVISLANIATVLDHSYFNYKNYFHYLHHSKYQNYNFQQPFFTYWDRLFRTYKV